MKIKKSLKKCMLLILALTTIMLISPFSAYSADPNPQTPSHGENTYSKVPFSVEYSTGYFSLENGVGSDAVNYADGTVPLTGANLSNGYYGVNTTRQDDIYIDYKDGAIMNGDKYDVRQYVWQDDCQYWFVYKNGTISGQGKIVDGSRLTSNRVHCEYHFYKSGTLATDNPVEVPFYGVMRL